MKLKSTAAPAVPGPLPKADPDRNLRPRHTPDAGALPGGFARSLRAVLRGLIAILLLWAGLSKLGDPVGAYTTLLAYELPFPKPLLKLVALSLPWLELLCGLMIAVNFHRRVALQTTVALFGIFLIVVGQALLRGLEISCGCFSLAMFGIDDASATARFLESVGFAFVRNLVLLGTSLYLLRTDAASLAGDVPVKAPKAR